MALPIAGQLQALAKSMTALMAVTEAATLASTTLQDRTNALQKSMSDMLRIQESLTISNREAIQMNTLEMISLRGGFRGMAQSQTELVRLGFSRNVGAMAELGAAMKISNQNMGEYIELNRMLFGAGGVQEAAIHSLAKTIEDTAIKSGMSNELLIKGINALKDEMVSLSFIGGAAGGGPAAELMLAFQSAVPPAMNEVAVNLGKSLMSSQVDVNQLARLGIEDLVNRAIKGQGDINLLAKQIIETASQNYTQIVGDGANQSIRTMQALDGVLGTMGKQFVAMEKAFVEATGTFDGISKLTENLKEMFFQVLDYIGGLLAPALKSVITGISAVIAAVSVALAPLAILIAGIGNVIAMIGPIMVLVGALAALFTLQYTIQALWTSTMLAAVSPLLGPLLVIAGIIGGIASLLGYDLAGTLIGGLTSFFNAKEYEEKQASLKRVKDRGLAMEAEITSMLQSMFGVQYSVTEELARVLLRRIEQGIPISSIPTQRPTLQTVTPTGG